MYSPKTMGEITPKLGRNDPWFPMVCLSHLTFFGVPPPLQRRRSMHVLWHRPVRELQAPTDEILFLIGSMYAQHLQRGAKWFLKGINSPSLRV